MNTFLRPPGRMFSGLPGPYYGASSAPTATMSPAQLAAMQRTSAEAAADTTRRSGELQLKLEAQRNSYATALADREKQNELELQKQASSLEDALSLVSSDLEEDDGERARITGFQNSLLAGMGMGVAGAPPASGMQGGVTSPEVGSTPLYGARARPV